MMYQDDGTNENLFGIQLNIFNKINKLIIFYIHFFSIKLLIYLTFQYFYYLQQKAHIQECQKVNIKNLKQI